MQWEEIYKERLTTAEEAVTHIKSGDRVVQGGAAGSPEILLEAMLDNKEAYENVEIIHMLPMGPSNFCLPENVAHFIHNSFFVGPTSRKAVNDGRAVFTPSHFSQMPRLFAEKILPVDVTICMLSVPDEHGYCSFGVSVDYTKPAAESSKIVIAEVTPHMPRTLGDSLIHVSKIDHIIECDSRPMEMQPPKIGPVDEAIGGYCAELIRDGDCLQLGIGAVPDAILGRRCFPMELLIWLIMVLLPAHGRISIQTRWSPPSLWERKSCIGLFTTIQRWKCLPWITQITRLS